MKGPTFASVLDALYQACSGFVELRALPSKQHVFARPENVAAMRRFVQEHKGEQVYFGVATRKSNANGTADNTLHLPAFFCDLDFKTTSEQDARVRLTSSPLQPSLVINSGGGLHCYWTLKEPIDLTVERASATTMLRRLAQYFGGDMACAEVARVLRVPGTKNHKYAPPRPVVIEVLEGDRDYNPSDFDSWLPTVAHEPTAAAPSADFSGTYTEGNRNATLYKLARSLRAKGVDATAIATTIQHLNAVQCKPPLPDSEIAALIQQAVTQRDREDFTRPETATSKFSIATVTNMADVKMRPIDWHWKYRFARGKATIVAGEPGVSKSSLWIDSVARSTRGAGWPDGEAVTPCDCVIMTAEDALDDTVKPRLVAAGADLSRVHALTMVRDANSDSERLVNLERDIAVIEQVITDSRAGFAWIDPLGAYLPSKLDAKTDHQVRAVLAPLAQMAERRHVALGLVMHLAKNAERKVLHRVLGSIGFVAAARIVLAVAEDPDNASRRLLLPVKANICPLAPTLAYRVSPVVVDSEDGPCETLSLEWEKDAVAGLHVDDVFRGAREDAGERMDAETFLREYLGDGPKDAKEMLAAAESNGISRSTLFRVKSKLGVKATRAGGVGAAGRWIWSLRVSPTKSPTTETDTLRTLSENSPTKSPTTTKNLNIVSVRGEAQRGCY